jgi:serine/threonine protein phosphatase PrpC
MKITIGTVTDRGLNPRRTANEDRLLVLEETGVFLVADGVGGRRAGQVASQTVVDVFQETFSKTSGIEPGVSLEAAIIESNRRVFQESLEVPELEGMATTVVAMVLDGAEAIVGHVGDSRLYRFQDGKLTAETEDHSEVVEAIRAGTISPAMAAYDPLRNVLTRAIGVEPDVEPDIKTIQLVEGIRLLLCSDGITKHIPDTSLSEILSSEFHPQEICDLLKAQCYREGADDNLTAVVVDFGETNYRSIEASTASLPPPAASRIEVDLRPHSHPAVPPPATREEATSKVAQSSVAQGLPDAARPNLLRNAVVLLLVVVLGILIGRYYDVVQAWVMGDLIGSSANAQNQPGTVAPPAPPPDPDLAAARVLFEEKRFEKARDQLAELIRRSPENAEYRFWHGRSELELKNYSEAITDLNEAARLNRNLPEVFEHLARAYGAIGDRRNMEESLRKGRDLNVGSSTAGGGK